MKMFLFCLLLASQSALAWGPTGHRVVGEIAERNLNPSVRARVKTILEGNSLSRISNWPDEIKSEPSTYGHTFRWHYTDWPESMKEHNEENSSGILVGSINEQLKVLQDKKATLEKKSFALKFLVHLVGDLHQPLHVGSGLDQGGNTCKVFFHGNQTNLHALWDEGMIDSTKLSYTELAHYASMGRKPQEINSWKKGTVVDWARESMQLRPEVYPAEVKPTEGPNKHYCRKDITVLAEDMPKLAYEYSYRFVPVMEKRLHQAGIRLAVLLNQHLK